MKLISLNILGGTFFEPLMEFIKKSALDTDIFCFQEIFSSPVSAKTSAGNITDIFEKISAALPDFRSYFAPEQDSWDFVEPVDYALSHGQAIFVKKTIQVDSEGSIFVYRARNLATSWHDFPANFEYVRLEAAGKKLTVCNLHGIAQPGDKLDTPERLAQSKKVLDFLAGEKGAKIVCGDFNLMPETKCIKMFEEAGFENLISKYGIRDTRGKLSSYYGKPDFQGFADYAFVSPEIKVSAFEVPDAGVSDHLPLVISFS